MDIQGQYWLNPLNKIVWQNAIKARRSTVAIQTPTGGTQSFSLTYDLPNDVVHFKPLKPAGFVPRGQFRISTVSDALWLETPN